MANVAGFRVGVAHAPRRFHLTGGTDRRVELQLRLDRVDDDTDPRPEGRPRRIGPPVRLDRA